jgi:Bacteriophage T4-like portal protein (Gp20)
MAGFTDRKGSLSRDNFVTKRLKQLSKLGMEYDDMILRNSRAVGLSEDKIGYSFNPMGADNDDMYYAFAALSMSDTTLRKNISFYDKSYPKKRDQLRIFAVQDEIEEILDTIADESIVFDDSNFLAYPQYNGEIKSEIREVMQDVYNKIYTYFGFNDGLTAWNYYRKWLIDGYLAFEIIYNDTQDQIIGFKELDPVSLIPVIDDQTNKKMWIQYKGQGVKERKLYDSQVIYISYSSVNSPNRVSYAERLVRSFNLLRIMEQSRIIWAVTNASWKMKFIIPVGGKSKTRAKQSLSQLMHNYREIIDFDYDSGELSVNGKPMMQFSKEYWLPSKDGEEPQIEPMGGDGPDLSDTETLKYFSDKLKLASKIPFSRFDVDSPATYEIAAEGMLREEIKFAKFINRLRSIWQEILVKPTYIQMVLDNPALGDDFNFKSNFTIKFNKENVFEEMKSMDLATKRIEFITTLKDSLVQQDADLNEISYFNLDFLVQRYGGFTQEDLKMNERFKQMEALQKEGYSKEDAESIIAGEDKGKFKKDGEPAASDELDADLGSDELDLGV